MIKQQFLCQVHLLMISKLACNLVNAPCDHCVTLEILAILLLVKQNLPVNAKPAKNTKTLKDIKSNFIRFSHNLKENGFNDKRGAFTPLYQTKIQLN